MKTTRLPLRPLALLLLLGLFLGGPSPVDLLSTAEAASSKDQRRIKTLTRQNRGLKKTVATLRRQVAAARRPVQPIPQPAPFIEMVTVGNVGNEVDPEDGDEGSEGTQNFGAVPYEYSIGKYEVTLAQYAVFLNAVAATDAFDLYSENMATNLNSTGIVQNGAPSNFTYIVVGTGTRPVTFVSWFDAARFCNWLHNGRPTGLQTAATTENGAYPLNGATNGSLTISRNPGAKYWIPSEDEWYKAAYHQPTGQGGDVDNYWLYPTKSNEVPGNTIGVATPSNHANFRTPNNFYSVTQSGSVDPNQNYLTAVGSYPGSAGFYGTFDQGGNVWEWNDAVLSGSFRGLRGGSWDLREQFLRSSFRRFDHPVLEHSSLGFRVAGP